MSFTTSLKILRYCILISMSIFSPALWAQITWEPGYIVDISGKRADCQILYKDWMKNPRTVEYKLAGEKETRKATTADLLEFGVTGKCLFKSATVSIDLSSNNPSYAGMKWDPEWNVMNLFLKVLIEGKASLYYYQDSQIKRFYYSLEGDSIIPLIYHPYVTERENSRYLLVNESFKQQLLTSLNCNGLEFNYFETLKYTAKSMIQYFSDYNNCVHSEVKKYKSPGKGYLHLKVTAGCNNSYFSVYNSRISTKIILFDPKVIPSGGLEAEYLFPFLRNKWSLVLAPVYEKFESTATATIYNLKVTYQNIELPIGLRYSMYLRNTPLRFFLDAWFVPGFMLDFNSEFQYGPYGKLQILDGNNYALGAGIEWGRFSFNYRFYAPKDILRNYAFWSNHYNRISFALGYRIY